MAKTRIGSNATFLGGNKGLSIVGDHCYAYSGEVNVDNNATTLLFFKSLKGYLKAKLSVACAEVSGDNYTVDVQFNGVPVYSNVYNNTYQAYPYGVSPFPLIIPPLTEVKIIMQNISNSNDTDWTMSITGRVYD